MLSVKSAQNVRSRIGKVIARLKTTQRRYGCVFVRIKKVDGLINFEIEGGLYQIVCTIQSNLHESRDSLLMIKNELVKEGIRMTLDYNEWSKVTCKS